METPINLTKHSQRNLDVIMNFLLYAGLEAEYTKTAIDYIMEDHVDGEDSEEALLERAHSSELIGEDIFLSGDIKEENPCNLYAHSDGESLFLIPKNPINGKSVVLYALTEPQIDIQTKYRDEILTYCLGKATKDDEVSLKDIFMHGKYVCEL